MCHLSLLAGVVRRKRKYTASPQAHCFSISNFCLFFAITLQWELLLSFLRALEHQAAWLEFLFELLRNVGASVYRMVRVLSIEWSEFCLSNGPSGVFFILGANPQFRKTVIKKL